MKRIRIPKEVMAVELRDGRVTAGLGVGTAGAVLGGAVGGAAGGAATQLAVAGIQNAASAVQPSKAAMQFPSACCNCLAEGPQVRLHDSVSILNRGVAYVFRFPIPHCTSCADTANRKRPDLFGTFAVFLATSILVSIALGFWGKEINSGALTSASFFVGPLVGMALTGAWANRRRPRPGQASPYQAVHVSRLDMEFSGTPKGFELEFANSAYADRFLALNRGLGLVGK